MDGSDNDECSNTKIVFIPEWSIWDMVINHQYEPRAQPSKDFLYYLLIMKPHGLKITSIPKQLEDALISAFSDRKGALDFFFDQEFIDVETLPRIYEKVTGHQTSVLLLAYWKSLSCEKVYIVAEDGKSIKLIAEGLEKEKVKCRDMIITPKEALEIIKKENLMGADFFNFEKR